jgi:diacylglycerol O-acyltransferase
MKLTQRTLSPDPQNRDIRAPWTIGPRARTKDKAGTSRLDGLKSAAGSIAGLAPSALTLVRAALFEQQLTLPFEAPKTMFNVPIGGARRVAAQSWPLKRIIAIKDATGGTVNDVILAMCSGALRAYLIEQDALPDRPLIAMVPVSLRSEDDHSSGGNSVGAILCNLGTDLSDPAKRLEAIHDSVSGNKEVFLQLPKMQQLALSAFNMAPLALTLLPALAAAAAPPFNIVISNVPGAREPLYWHGARLDGNYPLSIALDGQALNITMSNNADNLDFGLVGCRASIPHLQRLLTHLEDSLAELEKAVGV